MEKLKRLLTNSKVLLAVAILLVLMNFVDGGLSFWAIFIAQIAYEANPVMAVLMSVSPYLFLAFKVVVPTFAAGIFYKYHRHTMWGVKLTTWMLWVCFFLYAGLMVHFGFLLHTAVSVGLL
jgi:hypothetical protein